VERGDGKMGGRTKGKDKAGSDEKRQEIRRERMQRIK